MVNSNCILVLGYSPKQVKVVLEQLDESLKNSLKIIPITDESMKLSVSAVFDYALSQKLPPGKPLDLDRHFVLMDVARHDAGYVMKAFKQGVSVKDVIFALPTSESKTWAIEEYLEHLQEEHDFMRQPHNNPEDDKDMETL